MHSDAESKDKNVDHDLNAAKTIALEAIESLSAGHDENLFRENSHRRRRRLKRRARLALHKHSKVSHSSDHVKQGAESASVVSTAVENDDVEYVPSSLVIPDEYRALSEVLQRFGESQSRAAEKGGDKDVDTSDTEPATVENDRNESSDESDKGATRQDRQYEEMESDNNMHVSERQIRRKNRLSVAQLKSLVPFPEVVEQWDVTASDPLLLAHLKACPGSVPVPVNWRQKRKYLQSKRGMEKLPFQLPSYIEDTGIGMARESIVEADASKTAKQKARERIRPKTSNKGMDMDYSVLRDAFFKFQAKPCLTGHGDIYYELREREVNREEFKPGQLSSKLRQALGIGESDPAPWLVAMQRYGPPPSYPNLVIPGLNAPIPAGSSFGFQSGGWGKPPVDVNGCPLYGDVFGEGISFIKRDSRFDLSQEEKKRMWGEPYKSMFDDEEEEESRYVQGSRKSDEIEAIENASVEVSRLGKDEAEEDANVAGGVSSVATGLETPADGIELRKGIKPGVLYEVLEQERVSVGQDEILGSSYKYKFGNEAADDADGDHGGNSNDVSVDTRKSKNETLLRKRKDDGEARDINAREAKRSKEFKF